VAGAWQAGGVFRVLAVVAAVGGALTAAYILRMLRAVVVGAAPGRLAAMTGAEWASFGPLAALALAVGLWPAFVLALSSSPVDALIGAVAR
jgi:NADH-quinone oxidoreductase subunit M